MTIEAYLDELQRFADESFHGELIAARVEYFAALGRISDTEESFEAHLDRFLDWFLFERTLPPTGKTLLRTFVDRRREHLSPEDLAVYEGFAEGVHNLFLVRKTKKNGVHLRDLMTKKKYFVADELPAAFTKGQVFEARLIPFQGGWCFTRGYVFHPPAATKLIVKRLKQISADDLDSQRVLLRDLAIRRLKADRYKHIDATQFYQF